MRRARVIDLVSEGVLRVEDGNHGNDRPRPEEFESAGVSFIRAADMTSGVVNFTTAGRINSVARARIRKGVGAPGDVILSHKGTVGKVAVAPADSPEFVCSPQTTFWRSLDESVINQAYLRYVLMSTDFTRQLDLLKGQTDMAPYVSLTDQRSMTLTLPDITHQRAIAEVLGSLDTKIVANTKLISRTSEILEASFALLCGRPKETIPFSELATVTKGVSYRSADLRKSSTALVTLKSFDRGGGYSLRGLKDYAGPFKVGQQIAPGELVVALTDLTQAAEVVGRAVRVPGAPGYQKLVASLDLAIVRPRHDSPVEFLLGVMLQGRFRAHCRSRTSGTTVLHLASDAIPSFDAPFVSKAVQENYAEVARPMLQLRDSLEYEMDSLASTRDALLPQLMCGKLRVRDAEKVLEDAGVGSRTS